MNEQPYLLCVSKLIDPKSFSLFHIVKERFYLFLAACIIFKTPCVKYFAGGVLNIMCTVRRWGRSIVPLRYAVSEGCDLLLMPSLQACCSQRIVIAGFLVSSSTPPTA